MGETKYNFQQSFLIIALFVSACRQVQPTLQPTASPTATEIPLSDVNLEPLLVVENDLPASYEGTQVSNHDRILFGRNLNPAQAIRQDFAYNGNDSGGVTVFLFETLEEAQEIFEYVVDSFGDKNISRPDVGDQAIGSFIDMEAGTLFTVKTTVFAFQKCHAVAYIIFGDIADVNKAAIYANRLAKRLEPIVCRGE